MMLENKTVVIFGAAGGIGSALAKTFSDEGAFVVLTGRNLGALEALATELPRAKAIAVDALDEGQVSRVLEGAVKKHGRVDAVINATGLPQEHVQGVPLAQLTVEQFMAPVQHYARTSFVIAKAAAKHMLAQQGGVIVFHTPEPARIGVPFVGGMTIAWAGMEALTRSLSAELAASGVRVVCLRTTGMPETPVIETVYALHAKAVGIERAQFQQIMAERTHWRRATRLSELAQAAAFAISDRATGFTGTTLNLTGGSAVD